jgi:hypothetical protein
MASDADIVSCAAPWPGTAARLLKGLAAPLPPALLPQQAQLQQRRSEPAIPTPTTMKGTGGDWDRRSYAERNGCVCTP